MNAEIVVQTITIKFTPD
jgi:hypothetical protein